ncbi:MAG: GNAT family N-acetyltransferase [Chloroflexia bacterium]|nr:GNAT family N-acetyltransferase [Chloroflexia bacterium]
MSAGFSAGPPPAWRVRPAEPADAAAIVDLLNDVYGHWGTLETWHWKYGQTPAEFHSPSAVADLDGRIVGHFGLVPLEAVLQGRIVRGAQAVDTSVLPAYRRQGIHTSLGHYVLGQAARAGSLLIYAFPGLLSLALNQRMGYEAVAFVPDMVRLVQPGRALGLALRLLPGDLRALWSARRDWTPEIVQRLARLRRTLLLLASQLVDLGGRERLPAGRSNVRLVEMDGFDERFDALWGRLQGQVGLGVRKNAAYLNWRYRLHPQRAYPLVAAVQGQELLGFLVLHHAGLRSEIVELCTLPDRPDVHLALLREAIAQAREKGRIILNGWMPAGRPEHALWRQAGFISQKRLHHLARRWPALARQFYQVILYTRYLAAGQRSRLLSQVPLWPLSMGDSDLV